MSLDERLIAAHASGNHASLVTLYQQAADAQTDENIACFFLTQAYVFALQAGAPDAEALHARLVAYGREE